LVIIISLNPTSTSGIIVLLKTPLDYSRVATYLNKKKSLTFPDFLVTTKQFSLTVQDDYSGHESTKIRTAQITKIALSIRKHLIKQFAATTR